MNHSDPGAAQALRAALARRLVDEGSLKSPQWQAAFAATPRHVFVPTYYRQADRAWEPVTADDPNYLDTVYSNKPLTTQVIDGRATSSSSQPGLMAEMLEALDVDQGHKVGEVATGTGYNAGLLCHRVGDGNLITIEVDADLAQAAEARLKQCGHAPTVIAGDARRGFPGNPVLDRSIVTCGFDTFPYALARGVRPGGIVVCPLGSGNVRLEATEGGALEGRFLAGGSYFMKARDEGASGSVPYPRDPGPVTTRTTDLDPTRCTGEEASCFVQSLVLGEFNDATDLDDRGNATGYRVWTRDGSWARTEGTTVHQAGPRRLWDAVEQAHAWFHAHGRPARERFGVTVTPDAQSHWLDEPGSPLPALG